jgi:cell division protein FtsW
MHALDQKLKWTFLSSVVLLSLVGLSFVYSAGTYWGQVHYGNSAPFLMKQAIYLVIASMIAYAISKSELIRNEKFWNVIYILSLLLLVAVLIPGIGVVRNGSQSWIALGPINLQPAEFAKIALLAKLSCILSTVPPRGRIFNYVHFILILLPAGLIMIQPDFGSAVILVVSAFILLLIAGYPLKFYFLLGFLGIGALTALIASAPYRLDRIKAYLDPWSDPLGTGFQGIQSLMAIGPAGLFGHGFGYSRQKYLYLPEPQNDFIFSIIAEEIGFIGASAVLLLFFIMIMSGFGLAARSGSQLAFFMIASMICMIGFQTFLNVGVVIGLLPVTGVTLPFISYGGSSLLAAWICVGIILNFSTEKLK